ncbi:hypothetical protein ACRJ4B_10290 [Streptomyces sp. GTA36]
MRKGTVLAVAAILGLLALSDYSRKQTGDLPDLRGSTLYEAQTSAASSFNRISSHDALGSDRNQLLAGNWLVCTQEPDPGSHNLADLVTLADGPSPVKVGTRLLITRRA